MIPRTNNLYPCFIAEEFECVWIKPRVR